MGDVDFDNMLNKPLLSVDLSVDKSKITFKFLDGSERSFGVEGDCCSNSWIEHLERPDKIRGTTILRVEDGGMGSPWDRHECEKKSEYENVCGHDCLQVYNTNFITNEGHIVLEYRNDSNGYYGGYLVDA